MKPRSERRRDERKGKDPGSRSWPINIWATAFIGVGITIIAVGGIFLFSDGGDDDGPNETPITSASASASTSDAELTTPITPDEITLEALARRTIEALPNGEWPSLYAEFTDPFQQRCSLEEFTAASVAAAEEQGANLALIRYVGVQSFNIISETRAALLIVGEITGRSQYTTGANFEKVDGVWRISPVADTSGCEAFDRISG